MKIDRSHVFSLMGGVVVGVIGGVFKSPTLFIVGVLILWVIIVILEIRNKLY